MSFSLAEAVVFFRGDDSKLSSDLGSAEKKTQSSAANMAKFLGGAIVGGATIAAGAIIGIGTAAFNVASDLDAATDQIGASLGLSADEAKAYGQTIKDVYANNFGDSIEDVGIAIENVAKQLELTADDPALKTITENAFRLRDVFGTEISGSVDAVKTLMENFGVTSEEAFDMLATGYERGLDRSGDFLDTIGEYSNQFAEGGASAVEFFSTLDTGLQGGMLGTDKAADAFKEFRVRIQDGSQLTADSLAAIGLSADEITAGLSSGALTVVDVWDMVQRGIGETEDPLARFNAGVGLIGSQFEDLGEKVIMGIDITNDWADGGLSSIANLDTKYTNLGSVVEGMWRKFQVGIAPAGEAMLGFVNDNLPAIQEVVDGVSAAVVEFIDQIPAALTGIKTDWDSDWGGMRTTVTEFANETPRKLAEMWGHIDEMFQTEGDNTGDGWERFLGGLASGTDTWLTIILDIVNNRLEALKLFVFAITALIKGDWEGFWTHLWAFADNHVNIILDLVQNVFGEGVRDSIVGFLYDIQYAWDMAWRDISRWWNSTFGTLGGKIEAPDLGIVNPQNIPQSNSQQFLNDLNLGLDKTQYQGNSYPQAGTSSYKFGDINVSVGAGVDPYNAGRQVVSGIQDELRARGF